MVSLASYLVYLSVLVRAAVWFDENPPARVIVIAMLAAYGAVMAAEPLITRRFKPYPFIYLPIQTGLVLALIIETPAMDFLPSLFFPLSFQAVQFFKPRLGFLWIGAFILAVAFPLLIGWEWELSGLAMVALFAGLNFLMGGMAHFRERADRAREESERLLSELSGAYRKLQDYAAQVEEYAAAQERARLARELHDSVTQTLFSMNLTVQTAQILAAKEPDPQAGQGPGQAASQRPVQQAGQGPDRLAGQGPDPVAGQGPDPVAGQLDRLQDLAHSAVGEIQVLVRELQPRPLLEEGLAGALQKLAIERQQRDGLIVHLEVIGRDRVLPENVAAGLYRITQEALNNIAKHAGVGEAAVRLDLAGRPGALEIEDQGAGFDPARTTRSPDHAGLPGMAERARELGWSLKIDSQPGRGTIVRVEEGADGATGES